MKKLYLLYIPNGLNSPEFEVLLSTAQLLIDKKKDVEIITCGGGVDGEVYATSKNVFSQSSIDKASYWVEGGYTQKYFDGSLRHGFKFKNTSIRFNLKIKLVYYVGKMTQYYLYNYLANYKFSFLKKVFNI